MIPSGMCLGTAEAELLQVDAMLPNHQRQNTEVLDLVLLNKNDYQLACCCDVRNNVSLIRTTC